MESLVRKLDFVLLIIEIAQDKVVDIHFVALAINALQEAAKVHLVHF